MSRYIDADKLYPDKLTVGGTLAISQSQIAEQPTADVRENIHGEWKVLSDTIGDFQKEGYRWVKCNNCTNQVKIRLDSPLYDFCPYCGADMRGEEHE